MQIWPSVALIFMAFPLLVGGGCAPEAPTECLAFASCFAGDNSPYDHDKAYEDVRSDKKVPLADRKEELRQAYGAGGNCWSLSSRGPVWTACHRACVEAIDSHCQLPNEDTALTCRESPGENEKLFVSDGLQVKCTEARTTLGELTPPTTGGE